MPICPRCNAYYTEDPCPHCSAEEIKPDYKKLEEKLSEESNILSTSDTLSDLKALKAELDSEENKILNSQEEELKQLNTENQSYIEKVEELKISTEKMKAQIELKRAEKLDFIEKKHKDLSFQLTTKLNLIESKTETLEKIKSDFTSLDTKIIKLEESMVQNDEKLKQRKNELEVLEKEKNELEEKNQLLLNKKSKLENEITQLEKKNNSFEDI